MSNNKQSMKLYTEEQVREMIVLSKYVRNITNEELLSDFTPIELPSDEEILEKALKQFPYPNDIKDKNDEIIKTFGVKPFNYAKIEKYRNVFTIGAKWMRDKIKGGNNEQQ